MAFMLTFMMALGLSVLVVGVGLIAAVVQLIQHGLSGLISAAPRGALTGLVIFASYFVAAALCAPPLSLLWPLRSRWWGQSLMAGVLGFLIYGTVGLASVLAYVHLNIDLIGYRSPADAWDSLWSGTPYLTLGAAVIGPVAWRLRLRDL